MDNPYLTTTCSLRSQDYKLEIFATISPMTVCIASIAEDGKKAILIADKMTTAHGVLPYHNEEAEKIVKMNDNVTVMWAGGVADARIILEKTKRSLSSKKWVKEIAQHLTDKYLEYLHEHLDQQHVKGRGIEGGIHAFYHDKNLNLDIEARKEINNILSTYTLSSNTAFVVCGKESDGAYRIYVCGTNPRFVPNLVTDGYAAIGSGGTYALASIGFSEYKTSLPVADVKAIALEAKKRAEKTPDVGKKEDIIELI